MDHSVELSADEKTDSHSENHHEHRVTTKRELVTYLHKVQKYLTACNTHINLIHHTGTSL